jgi:hypothetical protein
VASAGERKRDTGSTLFIRTSAWWRTRSEQLITSMPAARAMVAIARKRLVVIWHVLSQQVADQQADPVAVALRLSRSLADHQVAIQSGVSRGALVR